MRRRPWPIVILAMFQVFFEPLTNLFFNAWMSHTTVKVYFTYFIHQKDWLNLFYLFVLPPIMGLSVYAMKKWSYAIFIAGATWMLWKNFGLVQDGTLSLSYALAIYVGNIGFVSYFLLPKVTAPYMNPKLRWWESKARFLVDWPCRISVTPNSSEEIGTSASRVHDFSEGGLFVSTSDPIELNQTVHLRFSPPEGEIIALEAKAVFVRPVGQLKGFGLQFNDLDRTSKRRLAQIAKQLKKSGIPMRGGQESSWQNFRQWAETLFKTGHGLLPEVDSPRPLPPAPKTSDEVSAHTEKNNTAA